MTSEMVLQENRVPWASWIILAVVATLTILSGLWVGLTSVGSQTELSGRTWEEFAAADPEVATIYAKSCVGTSNGGKMSIVKQMSINSNIWIAAYQVEDHFPRSKYESFDFYQTND